MALTEADLDLLDSYVDDELSGESAQGLERRLSSEPELAEALEQVRFERDARKQFFQALEPTNAAVQQLVASVHRSVNRELIWTKRARGLRMVSGIAACLLVGFSGGYMFRGAPPAASPNPSALVNSNSGNREIVFPNNVGMASFGGNAPAGGNSKLVSYEVSLTDDAGHVIGVQRFPTFDQARDFANDVNRWHKGNNQIQNGGVRLIGDQF